MKQIVRKLDRKDDSHKGENGKVGVIAGSKDYTGAPALSSKAALRTGSDLTHILTSEKVRDTVASYSENFIVSAYSSDYFSTEAVEKAKELAEWSDSLLIGPGTGDFQEEAVQVLLSYIEKPCVVDAEAIKPALDAELSNTILTPHKKEAEPIKEKYGSIESFVQEEDVVVVLKGHVDKVYTEEKTHEIKVGNSSMTVGGTGDTLAGIITSLLAQGLDIQDAAKLGTWINGKAGEKASEKLGHGMLPTDLIEEIPKVMSDR